jgi:catechol 2,3-dioxygenase-like lactoylglutathione lyase family enzyme
MSKLGGFHHVALSVRDVDASIEWYSRILGFEILFREDGDERRACVMRFADGAFGVALVQHGDRPDGEMFDPRRIGLDHVGFAVASSADLDDWARRLSEAGVEHSGAIEVPPGAILNFKDPDGIGLALFWERSG